MLQKSSHDSLADYGRNRIFNTRLDHAGTECLCGREHIAEVQIVGEDNEMIGSRVIHDFWIISLRIANV